MQLKREPLSKALFLSTCMTQDFIRHWRKLIGEQIVPVLFGLQRETRHPSWSLRALAFRLRGHASASDRLSSRRGAYSAPFALQADLKNRPVADARDRAAAQRQAEHALSSSRVEQQWHANDPLFVAETLMPIQSSAEHAALTKFNALAALRRRSNRVGFWTQPAVSVFVAS
jgi:hypothetical protein